MDLPSGYLFSPYPPPHGSWSKAGVGREPRRHLQLTGVDEAWRLFSFSTQYSNPADDLIDYRAVPGEGTGITGQRVLCFTAVPEHAARLQRLAQIHIQQQVWKERGPEGKVEMVSPCLLTPGEGS